MVCGAAQGLSSDPTWIMVFGALVMFGLTYGPGRLANVAGPFIVARVYAELG